MAEEERNDDLKMRYSTAKATNISNISNQEEFQSRFETNSKEVNTASVLMELENKKSRQLNDTISQHTESDMEHQKLAAKVEELKTKLEQEKELNLKSQNQIKLLQNDLKDKEDKIKNQESKISDLSTTLVEKTNTLEQTNTLLKEKDEKLMCLQDTSKQEDQLKLALSDSEAKLKEMSVALKKERGENVKDKETILNLEKSLEEASKIGKELEKFLSEETAKTNKVQEELEFVINNVNNEKEEFYKNFKEFISDSVAFLERCNAHKDTVLKAVEEIKSNY